MNPNDSYDRTRRRLIEAIEELGHPKELGELVARNLGSERAMQRMTGYVVQVKPRRAEDIADEMLAIMEDVQAWKKKKMAEEANAAYNEYLASDLREEE